MRYLVALLFLLFYRVKTGELHVNAFTGYYNKVMFHMENGL